MRHEYNRFAQQETDWIETYTYANEDEGWNYRRRRGVEFGSYVSVLRWKESAEGIRQRKQFDAEDDGFFETRERFRPDGGPLETIHWIDSQRSRILGEYQYGSRDRWTKLTSKNQELSEAGDVISSTVTLATKREFDQDGRLERVLTDDDGHTDGEADYELRVSYEYAQDREVQRVYRDGELAQTITLEFEGPDGRLSKRTEQGANRSAPIVREYSYEFDDQDRLLRKTIYSETGDESSTTAEYYSCPHEP